MFPRENSVEQLHPHELWTRSLDFSPSLARASGCPWKSPSRLENIGEHVGISPALNGCRRDDMLKKLTTAVGMVMLVSSFALAGQSPTKPTEPPRVTQSQRTQTNTPDQGAKKHHKHHKKHHAKASRR
jgi:hypothetical protein